MQPNEKPQYSIDYLDQIASPQAKPALSSKLFPIVIIAGVFVALLVGVLAILGAGGGNASDLMRLSARLKTLQSIADSSQKTIKSSDLRGTNTNLSLYLTNTTQDLAAPLKANGINVAKISPKIVTEENGSKLKSNLEEARLNVVYDRTYAREMTYQLEALAALMQRIQANTKSSSFKTLLTTTTNQLKPIKQQFADFTAANS